MRYLLNLFFVVAAFAHSIMAIAEYRHEYYSNIDYASITGDAESGSTKTEANESSIGATFAYGYLMNDNIEPYFEFQFESTEDQIGDFKVSKSSSGWGLGLIFNLPIGISDSGSDDKDSKEGKEGKKKKRRKSEKHDVDENYNISNATWIPYVGLAMTSLSQEEKRIYAGAETKASDTDVISQLIFGTRYMIYDNVGLNFSLRLSYQDAIKTVDSGTENRKIKTLRLKLNMLSLTLFI